jgi:hypothetical protein
MLHLLIQTMHMLKNLFLGLCATWCITGCSQHSCTEIGCRDSASLSLQTADNHWTSGDYELTIVAGDTSTTCTFRLPEDLPPMGSPKPLNCDPSIGSDVSVLSQVYTCTETRTKDAVSQSCTPVADEYTLEVMLPGTPSDVVLRLDRDGTTLVDQTQALTYKESRPNGPDCGPVCQQASVVVAVP